VTKTMRLSRHLLILCSSHLLAGRSYSQTGPVAQFRFDGNIDNAAGSSVSGSAVGSLSFVEGLDGQALSIRPGWWLPFCHQALIYRILN